MHAPAAIVAALAGRLRGVQTDPNERREPVLTSMARESALDVDGALDAIEMGHFLTVTRIEPASLDGFVHFASGRYTRHLVYKDHDVELLVLCWARGAVAPIHGHEGEYCWARVERGQLTFRNYREVSRAPLKLEALGAALVGRRG